MTSEEGDRRPPFSGTIGHAYPNGVSPPSAQQLRRATSVLSKHHVHADARDVLRTAMAPQSIVPLLTTAAGAVLTEYAHASSLDAQGSMALVLAFEDTARAATAVGF